VPFVSLGTLTTSHYAVVMTAPRSVRFEEGVLARLNRYVKEHPGSSSSSVANMFIDEALRGYEHPGIVFQAGPTGRRATLSGGPDVWEVVTALHAIRDESPELAAEPLLQEVSEVTGLTAAQVRIVVRYYAAYPDEIDERITLNSDVAEREEQLWAAQQTILRKRQS
jgi:hypothetical protein